MVLCTPVSDNLSLGVLRHFIDPRPGNEGESVNTTLRRDGIERGEMDKHKPLILGHVLVVVTQRKAQRQPSLRAIGANDLDGADKRARAILRVEAKWVAGD